MWYGVVEWQWIFRESELRISKVKGSLRGLRLYLEGLVLVAALFDVFRVDHIHHRRLVRVFKVTQLFFQFLKKFENFKEYLMQTHKISQKIRPNGSHKSGVNNSTRSSIFAGFREPKMVFYEVFH